MTTNLKLVRRTFAARIADLGFAADLPEDWIQHDLPAEDVDFANPTAFVPLAVVTAPHAAVVFTFAARPAYDDGTLHDWAWYLLENNGLQPRAVGRDAVADVAAVSGEAVQPSDLGPMVVRFAFLEDGGRLINLTLTAPELFADTLRDAWFAMLRSFRLAAPRGSRFAIEDHPDLQSAQGEGAAPVRRDAEPAASAPASPAAPSSSKLPSLADFAIAPDAGSLDPDHPLNANLCDRGIGLVPNVVAVKPGMSCASVAAGAVMAQLDVPFGWHVIDDGRRTLVFEPGGAVQINLDLVPREGRSNQAILDAIEAQMRSDYPQPEFMRVHEGRIHALGARNIADGEQPIEQYHMLYPFRDQTMLLRARVTTTPERASDACNLAELILENCAFDAFQLPSNAQPGRKRKPGKRAAMREAERRQGTGDLPDWWLEAIELEARNELEAAEERIRDGCPHIGFAHYIADMYRSRMLRLKQAGDEAGALAAFRKASGFIAYYASLATSGGEGAALSAERDEFRARLVAEFGSDPEQG